MRSGARAAAVAVAEKPHARSRSSTRLQLHRQRQKRGEVVLQIVVHENRLADFLIESGRMVAEATADRRMVEAAVARVLEDLVQRWCTDSRL